MNDHEHEIKILKHHAAGHNLKQEEVDNVLSRFLRGKTVSMPRTLCPLTHTHDYNNCSCSLSRQEQLKRKMGGLITLMWFVTGFLGGWYLLPLVVLLVKHLIRK